MQLPSPDKRQLCERLCCGWSGLKLWTGHPDLERYAAIYNLEIQPGASLELGTYSLTVEGDFVNNGKLQQTIGSVPSDTVNRCFYIP